MAKSSDYAARPTGGSIVKGFRTVENTYAVVIKTDATFSAVELDIEEVEGLRDALNRFLKEAAMVEALTR